MHGEEAVLLLIAGVLLIAGAQEGYECMGRRRYY